MLVPIGLHLVNEDDVIYVIQRGPESIQVQFRNGEFLNIESKDPQRDLRECAVYIANKTNA